MKTNDLSVSVRDILNKYSNVVGEALDKTIETVAKEAKKEISAKAPGSGKYSKSWRARNTGTRTAPEYTIYSELPGLPHLLEHGHAKRGGGRTRAFPHIGPVEENLPQMIETEITKLL